MTRVEQVRDMKQAVYDQMVSFFETNQVVFTGLDLAYTQMFGLHETVETTSAMQEETGKGLETLAKIGGQVDEEAVKVAYGPTYCIEQLLSFIDAVATLEEKRYELIGKYRLETDQFVDEVEEALEKGKQRCRNAILEYARPVNVIEGEAVVPQIPETTEN